MISSLSIKNFKNLSGLQIPELSRINLISGKNNVGKTSLLEALRLLISDKEIVSIIAGRGEALRTGSNNSPTDYPNLNLDAFSSLFTGRNKSFNEENRIEISDGENSITVQFVRYILVETVSENDGLVQRSIIIDDDNESDFSGEATFALELKRSNGTKTRIPLRRSIDRHHFNVNNHTKLICVGSNYDNADFAPQLWDAITLTDKESYVIDALRIVEPGIESLAYLDAPSSYRNRYPVVKVKGMDTRMPLRSMGDGINHILAIILAMVNCENGCLLIDKIDNGLHYTIQKQLWSVIFSLATKLNVQVFATTHSSDCISSFSKVLNDGNNSSEGRYIRLEYKSGSVCATEYTPEDLDIVAAQNIEIR